MPVQWERLAGDTSRFAIRLAFAPDPDGGRAATPDLARSWGSFQLWVDGRNLCAHREEGERVESVHWYLLPLMEWFARNWNALLHEEQLPVKNDGGNAWASLRSTRFAPAALAMDADLETAWQERWQGWWSRHALRAASDGGCSRMWSSAAVAMSWKSRGAMFQAPARRPGSTSSSAANAQFVWRRPKLQRLCTKRS